MRRRHFSDPVRNGLLAGLALVLLAGPARADDASFVGDGAAVFAGRQDHIRMVKEDIHIAYDAQTRARKPWRADCWFTFESSADAPIPVQMGFPDWKGFGDEIDPNAFVIDDFRAEIGGLPVETQLKALDPKAPAAPWRVKGKIATFDGAFTWPVTFKPHEQIIVHNSFSFGGFSSNGPFSVVLHNMPPTYPKLRRADLFWNGSRPRKTEIDFANSLVGAVAYIMTTARTWDGPIGQARITIDLPPLLRDNPHFMLPKPAGYRLSHDSISWEFKDYLPREEIVIYFISATIEPESGSDEPPKGFESKAQAEAWLRFSAASTIAPEVLEQLIRITPDPGAKRVLERARDKVKVGAAR